MKQNLKIILAWCILIVYAILVSSCTTETKVQKWLNNHQLKQAEWCSQKYPVKTEYVKGEEILKVDTTFVKGDSIPCPETVQGKIVKVKCPDNKAIYSTILRVDTVVKENTAQVSYFKGLYDLETVELIKTKDKLIEANTTAKKRLNLNCFLIGGLILSIGIHFRKFIFPFL